MFFSARLQSTAEPLNGPVVISPPQSTALQIRVFAHCYHRCCREPRRQGTKGFFLFFFFFSGLSPQRMQHPSRRDYEVPLQQRTPKTDLLTRQQLSEATRRVMC